jgi:hypothetical protein
MYIEYRYDETRKTLSQVYSYRYCTNTMAHFPSGDFPSALFDTRLYKGKRK